MVYAPKRLRVMSNIRQSGFTYIKLTMIVVISVGMTAAVLLGLSTLRAQTRFSDAVERLREAIVLQRTEANSIVQPTDGENTGQIAFGRVMTFTPGSGIVNIRTLTTSRSESPDPDQFVTPTADSSQDYTIAWSVVFKQGLGDGSAKVRQVAFIRSPRDGSLHSIVSPPGGWALVHGNYRYSDFITGTVPAGASLVVGTDSRTATIDIDPATNGVGRRF